MKRNRGNHTDNPWAIDLADALRRPNEIKFLTLGPDEVRLFARQANEFHRLRELEMPCCGIKRIPSWVFKLGKLEKLNLSQNELELVPASIDCLDRLRQLHLDHNRIRRLSPSLGNLRRLELLELSLNCLRRVPSTIGRCRNLVHLGLSSNQLPTVPREFGAQKTAVAVSELQRTDSSTPRNRETASPRRSQDRSQSPANDPRHYGASFSIEFIRG